MAPARDEELQRAGMGRRVPVKRRDLLAFAIAAALAALVWILSAPITGKSEPWDDQGPYYLVALAVAGAISGALIPGHFGSHYLGAVLGQVAYELLFLPAGPLFGLGVAFLAAYSGVFLVAVVAVAALRQRGWPKNDSAPQEKLPSSTPMASRGSRNSPSSIGADREP